MKPFYFTFGQAHKHVIDGEVYDVDTVVKIVAEDYGEAREIMFSYFGCIWSFQYDSLEELLPYNPKIKELKKK